MLRTTLLRALAPVGLLLAFTGAGRAQTTGPRPLITQAIDDNGLVTLVGNTRPEANRRNDLGPVEDDLRLDMYLQLKRSPEQELAAQKLVESLTDKTSANFHKWITAAQFGERFGAASADIAVVSGWLEAHGFTVNGVSANGMVIDFSGTAGQVREALHTEIHNLDVAGRRYFANMTDPRIPAALLPVVTGVVSLSNIMPPPMYVPRAQYTVSTTDYPLVPGDLATIYNLNPAFAGGYTGQGETIVVAEDTDLYNGTADWSTFRETFGLAAQYPGGSVTQVHPAPKTGGTACTDPGVNGDDAEAAIDVEWASAAAPNAAIVMASCAGTTNFGGFIALQNLLSNGGPLPAVVSISYGAPETELGAAENSYINTLYQTAAAAGVSVFVSSGDNAAAVADRGATAAVEGVTVSGFASTVYNVAVGGTDFGDYAAGTVTSFWNGANGVYYNSAKSYVPEIPWNDSCGGAVAAAYYGFGSSYGTTALCNAYPYFAEVVGGSGGPSGCATGTQSVVFAVSGTCAGYAKPSWQSIFGNPNDGVRDIPDVALFASNGFWGHYYVVCLSDGGSCTGAPSTWAGFGGTSVSAPIMAGIQTLINQALGNTNVGNPNPVYYEIGQSEYNTAGGRTACNSTIGPASTCGFNDITQGDIVVPCAGVVNCYTVGQELGLLSTSDMSFAPAYAAAPGWDFATGIGSVSAFNLLNAFVDSVAPSMTPAAPVLTSPTNGSAGVTPSTALTWNASAGATSYDVYLGTASTPQLVANTVDLNYTPAGLTPGSTYYWAVGARNSLGVNVSAAWSFTTNCVSALSPSGAASPAAGGSAAIPVTGAKGCGWTAVSNAAWITITSGASGTGNGTVAYTVAADSGDLRVGTITITGQTFTVTQGGVYPLISTLAGGATPTTPTPGTSVSIPVSYGIAADAAGNTYFASPILNAVFRTDPAGVVTFFAGTSESGYSGDGGPALSAQLNNPNGVAVDTTGNVYIADSGNLRIRKVNSGGVITTVAGNGQCCYGGDGGAAISAQMNYVSAVTVDASGNLYFADVYNQRVREVNSAGIITTVAGNGTAGYSGDGGAATSAELQYPYGLTVDGTGNLYISDTDNQRVRKVSTSGIITTVAGNGNCCYSGDGGQATSAQLAYPDGVIVDAGGNLYIADTSDKRIRKVNPAGTITTVAGDGSYGFSGDGGAATSAELSSPEGMAEDASGNLYITDTGNQRIRKVSASGTITTAVGGAINDGGPGVFGLLNQPAGVARDSAGNTYIADSGNNRVRLVAVDEAITTVAGTGAAGSSGDGGTAADAQLNSPQGVAVDSSGNVYIADTNSLRVRKVDKSGTITTVAGDGNCCFGGDGGLATSAQLLYPAGVAADASGNLFIADTDNNRVRKVSAAGVITTVAGDGTYGYSGDGGAATGAELGYPSGVAVDSAGNLYIADTNNNRIREVSSGGIITTVAGNGTCCYGGDGGPATSAELSYPRGVAVDAAGDLFIADGNQRVREVAVGGTITTVAGGSYGYSGDGGPAIGAAFRSLYGVAVDAAGFMVVADQGNNAVRLLTPEETQPVLTIQSAHVGSFTAGTTGSYTVTVNNGDTAGPATGGVTMTETLPSALTAAGMSGSGWSCSGNTCSRSDPLAGGSSYPPITVMVNVGAAAQSQATNVVTVAAGGVVSAAAEDLTVVQSPQTLTVTKTHTGNFTQGQVGATYTVTVSNTAATGATSGTISVTDTLPPGLTLVSMAGTGWACSSNSCSRSDALAAGLSYPIITVTVNVATGAISPQVNSVSVSGETSAAVSATDSTVIEPARPIHRGHPFRIP